MSQNSEETRPQDANQQAIAEREKAKEIIEKVKESSQNDYETNIIYITAGTLVLSLTFIEKIAPLANAQLIWMLIASWSFLSFSIAVNLFSHWYSAYLATKLQKMLNNLAITATAVNTKIDKFNARMQVFNIFTFSTMFLGILFLVLYCSKNVYHMSELENKDGQSAPKNTDTIQKGRTFSPVADYHPTPATTQQPAQTPSPAPTVQIPPPANTTEN